MMRDLKVEQYHIVYPEQDGSVLNWPRRKYPVGLMPALRGKNKLHLKYAYHCCCPVNDYTILLTLHMSACHNTGMHSPFKTVLMKITDKYQAYCTTYKTHAMATCHRGAGCPLDRDIDLHIEEAMGIDNDNENTHGLDITVALGGPEAGDHPNDPIYSNQDTLMTLMREINDLHQCVEVGEG